MLMPPPLGADTVKGIGVAVKDTVSIKRDTAPGTTSNGMPVAVATAGSRVILTPVLPATDTAHAEPDMPVPVQAESIVVVPDTPAFVATSP